MLIGHFTQICLIRLTLFWSWSLQERLAEHNSLMKAHGQLVVGQNRALNYSLHGSCFLRKSWSTVLLDRYLGLQIPKKGLDQSGLANKVMVEVFFGQNQSQHFQKIGSVNFIEKHGRLQIWSELGCLLQIRLHR